MSCLVLLLVLAQVKKVKDFYDSKTDEISQRMEVLVESFATSGLKFKTSNRKTLVESITQKFENMRRSSMYAYGDSSTSDIGLQFSESLDDNEDPEILPITEEERQRRKEEMTKKSDSIKRAITDIYRTAKLLHNYSIMVS